MIYLFFSVLTNAAIYLLFKVFERKGVNTFPALVVNYITAFAFGVLMVSDLSAAVSSAIQLPVWSVGGLSLGLIFLSTFYLMAITAQRVGVSVATIASKMSLALAAVIFVLVVPDEKFSMLKAVALIAALAGVVFASLQSDGQKFQTRYLVWPLLILLGSTAVDFGIAYLSSFTMHEYERELFPCLAFGVAALSGICLVAYQVLRRTLHLSMKDVLGGLVLGLVNYGSVYFLVMAYEQGLFSRSITLCINNLAVVLIAALGALLLFREKPNKANLIGIALSIFAIVLLAFV
ncbi:MAG: EamA family transporter [Flavobacteriales bacterium]